MTIPPNVKYVDLFKKLYEEAREEGRGLWKEEEKWASVAHFITNLAVEALSDNFEANEFKENGINKMYYKSGEIYFECNYEDGKANGHCKEYYKNGRILSEDNVENDLEEGVHRKYYESGKLKTEEVFKGGVLKKSMEYDEDGNLIAEEGERE